MSQSRSRPRLTPLERRDAPAVFTVSSTADSGEGSLRQAILDANAPPGADQIRVSLTGPSATVHLLSALPEITETVDLDGAGQQVDPLVPVFPRLELDGSGAGATADG